MRRSRSDGTGRGVEKLPSAPPGARAAGADERERAAAKMMKEREREREREIRSPRFQPSLLLSPSRSTSAVNDHFREDNLPCLPAQSYKRLLNLEYGRAFTYEKSRLLVTFLPAVQMSFW